MPIKTHITDDVTSNRVTDALYLYAEQEVLLKISRPIEGVKDVKNIQMKYDYYKEVFSSIQKNCNRFEKQALLYIKHELAKMNARLNPTFVNTILYSSIGNRIRNLFNGNNILYERLNTNIQSIQRSHIRNYNIERLTAQLKELGFSSSMESILQKMVGQNVQKFHVRSVDLQNRTADFVLHFKKLPATDIYFLEKFDARSAMPLTPKFKKTESCIEHTFHTNEHPIFSVKEAANLVNGKAVCKEIDGKEIWMSLNNVTYPQQATFNRFHFDLIKELEKLPIKEMHNISQRNSVLDALKSGNKKEVTLVINEQPLKCSLEASPFNKIVNIMDKDNRLVDLNKLVGGTSNKVIQRLSNLKLRNDEIIFVTEPPRKRRAVS